jgi:hypothetical protein
MGGGDYATDFPRVDTYGTETTVKVKNVQDSFGYSDMEIKRAAKVGRPLEAQRALAARKTIDTQLEVVAKTGDTATGLKGLFNQTGVTEYTVPDGATGAKTQWTTKTADEMLADLNGIIFAIQEGTAGIENPDNIGLPQARYNLIKTTRIGTDSLGKTVLQYFLEQNPGVTVDWYAGLESAAPTDASYDGNMMMVAWKNTPDKLVMDLPQPFTQMDLMQDGLMKVVPCRARTAGVTVFYPKSVAYAYGI